MIRATEVVVRPRVDVDVLDIAMHLLETSADPDLPGRFVDAYERTKNLIVENPMGPPLSRHGGENTAVRQRVIEGFTAYLLFYAFDGTRMTMIRVLHGARDLPVQLRNFDEDLI